MKVTKLDDIVLDSDKRVKVTTAGNVVEIMYSEKKSVGNSIVKLNSNEYLDKLTGEIKEYKKTEDRSQSKNELRKTFKNIRDVVNCNVTEPNNCKWVTLTYAENMTDTVRLYKDAERFIKRLRYKYGKFEYIQVVEPQGRGAWHIHMIMIFAKKAPFIPNNEMADIWGNGFTVTRKMDDIDNLGAYLSAYLGDIELNENDKLDKEVLDNCVGLEVKEVNGKKYIKGGRLHMYPTKFNILRCSRGVKRPIVEVMSEEFAQKKVSAATLTFQKTIHLTDGSDYENTLNYRYYNMKRSRTK